MKGFVSLHTRIQQYTKWLNDKNIDFSFITSTPNVFYLSKFYSNPHERLLGIGIFANEEPFLVCPKMEVGQARAAGWDFEIIGYSDTENPWQFMQESIQKRNVTVNSCAIESSHLTYERSEQLRHILGGATFISAEEKLHYMRMVKDDQEISILREAAKLADFGVEVGVSALASGKTEMEVLAQIEFELKKKGIREMSFSTMVLYGEKSADPHGNPGLKKLANGDFVLFDLGVVLDGYCSDITRTVAYGDVSDKQKEIYNTVLKAEVSALEACKIGTRIGDLDKIARGIITEAGYGEYFPHRLGHGLGIDVHEFPSMNETNNDLLQEGMTFTIEPGIYVPSVGGVRIEDDVLITKDGYESLTQFPKELQIIK
ncbi:peptidase M24 family protein [Lottiidibacillus patelloidae]|uniref:Peptidase M24 family protein n=1 Tax=Lottiidibacillus patelloidae TaxID=2670334 RepID=A0A263BW48_9BACI|nr:Xaa-Pro peptidase family protein [Lottiidibacillus patelloidae]OZM57971.1 peptidase M24 family protein [Lottiidibacillus patelloidae]